MLNGNSRPLVQKEENLPLTAVKYKAFPFFSCGISNLVVVHLAVVWFGFVLLFTVILSKEKSKV